LIPRSSLFKCSKNTVLRTKEIRAVATCPTYPNAIFLVADLTLPMEFR
jgi:hypothetical protein